ncbi:MAG: hypothetical protein C4532_13275 [Candidatus Abyssobacteria bacterium SURF_17]|jgi:saccharopine dehydrogenase-like NADP-dependent oxidoreductase|uniref:Saccharopine dehydrogenase NADP binding domain-containing protein n=1 Tax=Candidatus Abyssobacteria bacterium SURF_17 TaxID=2093361 RepID=A0A419EUN6_9BACT|nr:MAG: hypothetical protein C4532_13275 [Candidatus Abyssubacteria bacterium SURF_17]
MNSGKVIVLGGCGAVGSVAVRSSAAQGLFSKILIGDMDTTKAKALAAAETQHAPPLPQILRGGQTR